MSVRTAQLVKGVKSAQAAVGRFGKRAEAAISNFGGLMGETGLAIAGVVNEFYVRPLMKAAGAIGGVAKEIGASLSWVGKGMTGPINRVAGGMVIVAKAAGRAALAVGRLALRATVGGFKLLGRSALAAGRFLRTATNQLVMFGLKAAGIAGYGLYKVAKLASGLAEQANRAQVMFGAFSGTVIAESETMSRAFGVSKTEFLGAASAFSGMFQAAGYDKEQAASLSTHFVKLATDLSSLANIPVAEALEKIQSGLAGEVRPLREVGVFMSEAAIKAQAAKMGIAKLGTELNESQKIQARVAFITQGLAFANGDLARTADSAENAARGFMGRLQNLAETVGTALLPIVGEAMSQLQVGVEALSLAWGDMTAGIVNDQVGVVGAVGETANSMGWLQKSVGFVADAFQALKIGFYVVQSYITAGIGTLVSGFATLISAIDYVSQALGGAKTGLADFLNTYSADLKRLSEQQYATAQATIAGPAASEGVGDYFARAQERIKAMRAEATKPGIDVTALKPNDPLAMAGGKAKKQEHASALVAGSREAANAVLRSRYGGKGAQDQTAQNTKRSADLLAVVAGGVTALVAQRGAASPAMVGGGAVLAGNL